MKLKQTSEEVLAAFLYNTYCEAVGGYAFNGEPLPDWAEFGKDPNKRKQANAWRSVATKLKTDVK